MTRLQRELHRLYLPQPPGGQDTAPDEAGLIDAQGRVRAMVLALARPADWQALSKVWNGVQLDLALPAPAIAVAGEDGYQLWFSLAEPVPAPQALAFLESLRVRYLGAIATHRVSMMPAVEGSSPLPARHARWVPALQAGSGRWSAFVAPDLAPVFADEPWLDLPPNPDGQASLLAQLTSAPLADFQQALDRLGPAPAPPAPAPASASAAPARAVAADGLISAGPAPKGAGLDARRFLLDVMNNDSVALGLRIEAAKALLQAPSPCPGEGATP